jgi:ribosomal-protein-alanine N-acetyltransferase
MGVGVITIRPFDAEDVSAAVGLEERFQPQPWTPGVFADELDASNRSYFAADDGRLVGFGGVMVIGDEAHINNLLVEPSRRRRGIGLGLMRRMIEVSLGMGARHLTLEVRSENDAAIGLYRRLGMEVDGVRRRYYPEDDALVMWARDICTPDHQWRSA